MLETAHLEACLRNSFGMPICGFVFALQIFGRACCAREVPRPRQTRAKLASSSDNSSGLGRIRRRGKDVARGASSSCTITRLRQSGLRLSVLRQKTDLQPAAQNTEPKPGMCPAQSAPLLPCKLSTGVRACARARVCACGRGRGRGHGHGRGRGRGCGCGCVWVCVGVGVGVGVCVCAE